MFFWKSANLIGSPTGFFLTIRLWARDFYEVIVDKAEAESIITSYKLRANNLIVLEEF